MRVFINRKSRYTKEEDCHLEHCKRGGVVRKGEAMFTLNKYTSTPPYDAIEVLWFHPECFLVWCLEALLPDKGLDGDSQYLLDQLPTIERLIKIG
ncbi:hypothetical protein LCGC14_1634340 [marine sediment metagenome]|uniref:Uncharacterized protein n=1 Tax=marine sediment metagenome TaxID=412755 RepID=A0A0F9INY9_9ZZZZ